MSYRCRCTPRFARGLVLFAAFALVSPAVAAQDSALAPGAQIRIQSVDEKQLQEGTFRALTSDSLTYSPGLATSSQSIPLARVGRIEVSRYDLKARSVLTDAAIGSAVGQHIAKMPTKYISVGSGTFTATPRRAISKHKPYFGARWRWT